MANVTWTQAQKDAIYADGRTLLVSAAAGSGKTAVLTERIIEKLKNGTGDLGRMLIVTFTRAAAKELKSRISTKLTEALARDPANKHLAKQLSSIAGAKICTIDSFCIDIVKRNFDKLGLPCGIRVADTAEMELLKAKIMDAMFDDFYDEGSPFEGFDKFTDCFITDKDDGLPGEFLRLYNDLCTMTEGIALIDRFADMMARDREKPFLKTAHGRYLRSYTEAFLDSFLPVVSKLRRDFEGVTDRNKKYYPEYLRIEENIIAIKSALAEDDYVRVCRLFAESKPLDIRGTSLKDHPDANIIRNTRSDYNSAAEYFATEFYSETPEQIELAYSQTEEIYRSLWRLLSAFDEKLKEEKQGRKIMDFNDAERYALKLLCEDGAPTECAVRYGELFDEIFIDEYQDINELQDTIFTMISGSAHRFMVGDIKQSIYGFRGSEPGIFADYRDRFPAYDKEKEEEYGTIFLSNNFRCSKPVIDFCNNIFGRVMPLTFGGVEYLPEDDLVFSKNENVPTVAPVEFILTEKDCPLTEEEVVAERIGQLIKEGYSPNDIVILLRSPKNSAAKYEEALKGLKIPCFNAASSDFFANPEILLVMCLLNVIDNPRRDIHLAGALESPVFAFTLDDLIAVRSYDKKGYLYDALCAWYKDTGDEKGRYFFEFMEEMRAYAANCPIDKLIWYLYTKTAMLSHSYGEDASGARRANLMMLYEYARTFENGSFKGLYNFIQYVNNLIENATRISEAKTDSDATPTVKIMSIHYSKGLEFRVCFLCDCDRTYTNYNSAFHKDALIRDNELGIAVYTPEPTGLCKVNNILRRIIKQKKHTDEAAEEMRLLYVALTRAKERLFVSGKCADSEKLYDKCEVLSSRLSPYTVISCNNYELLMRLALFHADTDPCWKLRIMSEGMESVVLSEEDEDSISSALCATYEESKALFEDRFAFRYGYTAVAELPSKLAVSRLYPGVLDEEEEASTAAPMRSRPRFLESGAKASAAERGTATHVFMQFCDFENVRTKGVDAETERLINKGFIPAVYREMIHRDNLEAFFSSRLFEEMSTSSFLKREMRFNIYLPASDFTENTALQATLSAEHVLVQGVIDCFFTDENDDIIIVDYKTDTFTHEQKEMPGECERLLRLRHSSQLGYYRLACKQLLGKEPKKTLIYSFDLGKEIPV